MHIFSGTLISLITEYKRLLRRYLPPEQRLQIIAELGIRRKYLHVASDLDLYHKAHYVLKHAKTLSQQHVNRSNEHSGIDQFQQHLETLLADYHIQHGRVIHIKRHASRALLEVVQLMAMPEDKLTKPLQNKLSSAIKVIVQCGSPEQQQRVAQTVETHNVHIASQTLNALATANHPG